MNVEVIEIKVVIPESQDKRFLDTYQLHVHVYKKNEVDMSHSSFRNNFQE